MEFFFKAFLQGWILRPPFLHQPPTCVCKRSLNQHNPSIGQVKIKITTRGHSHMKVTYECHPRDVRVPCTPGGATQLFSGRGVRLGFPKCGACELILASEKGACELKIPKFGGLWTENFQIWALWAKVWVKIEAVEAKISKFLKRGSYELTLLTLANSRRGVKRGFFRAAHPHTPFLGQCPPPGCHQAPQM